MRIAMTLFMFGALLLVGCATASDAAEKGAKNVQVGGEIRVQAEMRK